MRPSLRLPLIAVALCGVFVAVLLALPAATPAEVTGAPRVPVLLELFTSEGCSSCPPADRLLEALDRQPAAGADLIVLSEHVEYWNYLGWKDPYSLPLFSQRDQEYARKLGADVYTPQMVVDGKWQVLGSDRDAVLSAVARTAQHPKLPMTITAFRSGRAVTVHVDADNLGTPASLFIAFAADTAQTHVARGENGGRTLTHVAVAQSIKASGNWTGQARRDFSIPVGAVSRGLRIVAYLQDPRSGAILGVTQTKI